MSKLRQMFVKDPPSFTIAAELQAKEATCCEHGRNPCMLRCGVMAHLNLTRTIEWVDDRGRKNFRNLWALSGPWEVISQHDRLAWLDRVEELPATEEFEIMVDHRPPYDVFEKDPEIGEGDARDRNDDDA